MSSLRYLIPYTGQVSPTLEGCLFLNILPCDWHQWKRKPFFLSTGREHCRHPQPGGGCPHFGKESRCRWSENTRSSSAVIPISVSFQPLSLCLLTHESKIIIPKFKRHVPSLFLCQHLKLSLCFLRLLPRLVFTDWIRCSKQDMAACTQLSKWFCRFRAFILIHTLSHWGQFPTQRSGRWQPLYYSSDVVTLVQDKNT